MLTATRRGRVTGLALGLLILFLYITTRNSGSHPRDMRTSRFKDTEHSDTLRPILKEPSGRWDPQNDKFKEAHLSGGGPGLGLHDQIEAIKKQGLDLPAEGIKRKTPKKGKDASKASNLKDQVEVEKPLREQGGSGAVVPVDADIVEPYDPAEGMSHMDFLI